MAETFMRCKFRNFRWRIENDPVAGESAEAAICHRKLSSPAPCSSSTGAVNGLDHRLQFKQAD
jgi:hypothetical protein